MCKIKKINTFFIFTVILFVFNHEMQGQTDYSNFTNWAFHPEKKGTLIDGFNLDIASINENLNTTSVLKIENNSMKNTGVDVFFIHPTILQNISSYRNIGNVSIEDQNSNFVQLSIRGQVGLLSKYGRMFAPRYRQATPLTFINSPMDSQSQVLAVAYRDVKDAFLHYLNNYNQGNKIILVSHSQGAYLAGFLLRDLFDSDPQLQQKLVVAVVAGIYSNYATPYKMEEGWWENIPFCRQQNECGCIMNWRSYKEGQTPTSPLNAHPCLNPLIFNQGFIFSQMNLSDNWAMQDSLYYGNQSVPLQNFITLRSNVAFGGNVGYVAFDSMYTIRHLRSSKNQVGFTIKYNPKPNDQRPDFLEDEEDNPLFSNLGYHQKDYNIYIWALLKQIDSKLLTCGSISSLNNKVKSSPLEISPNPTENWISIQQGNEKLANQKVTIYDLSGRNILSGITNMEGNFSLQELSRGMYILKIKDKENKLIIKE